MVQETHPSYDFYEMEWTTGDTGHSGVRRDRLYVIGNHQELSSCKYDPGVMKNVISSRMVRTVQTVPSDYFMAKTVEVCQEAQQLAVRRGIQYRPRCHDLTYLLTKRELKALQAYNTAYRQEFHRDPSSDPNLVLFLGDNGTTWKTWSGRSQQIPTFRRNAKTGLFWSPYLKRYLVAREKLCAMGWPVSECMAAAMRTRPVPSQDVIRAADLAGNAMHFCCVANAQLVALSCFGPMDK